jgi:hypothetical protein
LQYDGRIGKSSELIGSTMPNLPDSDGLAALSVALVMPNATRRRSLVTALAGSQFAPRVHEFAAYPSPDELPAIARLGCQVLIVDLDDDVEQAIRVIENIGRYNAALTVMAASSRNDPALMRRSMQARATFWSSHSFPKAWAKRSPAPARASRIKRRLWGRRWFLCRRKAVSASPPSRSISRSS